MLKKLYQNILEACESKWAVYVLGILSFLESAIFIIPPEVMMLPMCYAKRKKAFYYAAITTVTSVLGACLGYYIGMNLWDEFSPLIFEYLPGFESSFDKVGQFYEENAVGSLLLAAVTPIPFKVFTIGAGVYHLKISLGLLVICSLIGRGFRYGVMAALVFFFGDKAQELIEKHLKLATLLIAIVGIIVLAIKFSH